VCGRTACTECAVRRFVVSPTQSGGTWREVLGPPGLPERESGRGPEHAGKAVDASEAFRTSCRKARTIWPKLDCLKSNPQGEKCDTVGMTLVTDVASCSGLNCGTGQPPWRGTPPSEGGQGDEWAAYVVLDTYSEDVPRDHLRGASPIGDGVPVVVAGVTTGQEVRESRNEGEGAQVVRMFRRGGTRNAEC
jgi:hypothetical protein